ncbi:DEAD-domain-containing protein [Phlebopus sp. FC_14]|nr:DEAD-domain-containing protein [Phlebopus sp. FC_14]
MSQTAEVAQIKAGISKAKTKAKSRYLKRKKTRRKARKSASQKRTAEATADSSAEDEASRADDESDEENLVNDVEAKQTSETLDSAQPVSRPKKRRKLTEEGADDAGVYHEEVQPLVTQPARAEGSPTHVGGLPSFPLPALPDAPSKSVLAMQGLDKALIHAEIINPGAVLGISSSAEDRTGLTDKTRKRLIELGITELFAVQTVLLPFLMHRNIIGGELYSPYARLRDVCVSAPTGSGKTLAYVLPIIETLSNSQVRETFEAVGKGRGLKIGTATGQHSFAHEQAQLVADSSSVFKGGSSKVDVLICTPGRLIDHLNGTPNFSLQHLRFLVIDEADRLLAQSFQDWLAQVLSASRPPHGRTDDASSPPWEDPYFVPSPDACAPAFEHLPRPHEHYMCISEGKETSCQKLLFSATLTRDPGKLASLGLRDPKYFVVQNQTDAADGPGASNIVADRFAMPSTLTEHMIVCESSQKPLMLLHLIHHYSVRNALVFTKSSESTTRLVRLLDFFEELNVSDRTSITIHAYSSDLPASERKTILERFKAQEIHILVCSDLISRGIDISHVSHVVSYDAPVDMRKYVHRVGRTARAGKAGDAWTLVEEQEARYFKTMLKEFDHLERIKRVRVSPKETEPLSKNYQAALQKLRDTYTR